MAPACERSAQLTETRDDGRFRQSGVFLAALVIVGCAAASWSVLCSSPLVIFGSPADPFGILLLGSTVVSNIRCEGAPNANMFVRS
jgi:hypothetical protein